MALLSGLLAGAALVLLLHRPAGRRLQDVSAAWSGPSPAGAAGGPRDRPPPTRASGRAASNAGRLDAGRPDAGPAAPARSRAPVLACALAGGAAALLLPLPVGLLLGAAVAVGGPGVLDRLEPQSVRDERVRLLADLPLVLDLLAACLAGGAALPGAVRAVAAAVGGPAGRRLDTVESMLAVGAPPSDAWAALAGTDQEDPLAPAARALARAADGGAPVAAAVSRLAVEARVAARSQGEQAARRVGVLVVAPLGLCFLPAFVLLGVVPVVAGLAGPLLAP